MGRWAHNSSFTFPFCGKPRPPNLMAPCLFVISGQPFSIGHFYIFGSFRWPLPHTPPTIFPPPISTPSIAHFPTSCLFCFVSLAIRFDTIRFVSRGAVSCIFVSLLHLYLCLYLCVYRRPKPPAITHKQPQKRQQLKQQFRNETSATKLTKENYFST